MIRAALPAIVVALAGCASAPPQAPIVIREPVEVRVPVAVPCVKQLPSFPELPSDAALSSLSDYELVLTIDLLRRRLEDYATRAQALLTACAKPTL